MTDMPDSRLIKYFSEFISENRLTRMEQVLESRTRYLTVALENIYQPHNASAVLRSCDGFGIQDVHIIENSNSYRINPGVALGTSQWLSLHRYNSEGNNTKETIGKLRKMGYRIVATTPHKDDTNLEDFDLSKGPAALVFGTEMDGLTDEAIENADEYLKIPMYGFVESFNISVSCAVTLHDLSYRLRNSGINWKLNKSEKDEILLNWLRNSIRNSGMLEEEFHCRFEK